MPYNACSLVSFFGIFGTSYTDIAPVFFFSAVFSYPAPYLAAVVPGLLGGGGKALTIRSTVLIADPGT